MAEADKQRDALKAGRPKPPPGGERFPNRVPNRPPTATLDLARQEKSLEALGRMLKTKREINGLTRRDVALKIKIPLDQLESIEEGRLSSLPPVFAKGFLRSYANELGLDAEAILDDYRKMTGGFKNEPAHREALAPRYVETRISSGRRWLGRRMLAALFLSLLGLGVVLAAWPEFRFLMSGWRPFDGSPAAETTAPSQRPAGTPAPVSDQLDFGASEAPMAGGRLAEPVPVENDQQEAVEIPAPGGELTLLSQKDGVWLQLAVDGQPVRHYWLKQGETVAQKVETSAVVRTGQAPALNAVWNGRDMGPLSAQPVVERRFPPAP